MTQKIIHLNMDELKSGKPFYEVMSVFQEWCGVDPVFCTWGSLDLTELQRNMAFYDMEPLSEGPIPFLDIQKLFSIYYEDGKSRRTLEYAVDYTKIEKKEDFHRALSDAYYTAKVFEIFQGKEIEKKYSIDVYHPPRNREEEVYVIFDTYSKYISREFRNKTLAMADKDVSSTRCYLCGRNAKRKVKWFSVNGKHYYSLSQCNTHGYFRGKIRMKKADSGNIYVVKTIKQINEEDARKVISKQDKLREQRKEKRKIERNRANISKNRNMRKKTKRIQNQNE